MNDPIIKYEAAFMKLAYRDVASRFPIDPDRGTGLVIECHDSFTCEEEKPMGAPRSPIADACAEALTRTFKGLREDVPGLGEPCFGESYAEA